MKDSALARLRKLRELRGPRERDLSLGTSVGAVRRELTQRRRGVTRSVAWLSEVVPADLREGCEVVGLQRGVLTLKVRDSAQNDALSRWLRSGGEFELKRASGVAMRRVKVVVV